MLGSAFVAFFRSFIRHPLYALLNLLGLSLGIAVFITLSLLYHFETSYESWSSERPHVYALGTRLHAPGIPDDLIMLTIGSLLDEIKTAYPQTDGTRDMGTDVVVRHGAEVSAEHMEVTDANFLIFFNVPILRGNGASALVDPSHIVLSARIARKYFGTINAIGRILTVKEDTGIKTYTVSAVIADLPKNSDLRFDMVRRLTPQDVATHADTWRQWGVITLETYLKFRNPANAAAFAKQIPPFTDRQAGTTFGSDVKPHKILELVLVPLADLHLSSPKLKAAIASLALVGILALGLALVNYVNLATARAGLRAREVAVRKTLGASPSVLRQQFLFETTFTLLLAFVVALSVVELSLPLINATGGLSLALYRADCGWIAELLACVLAAGLVAALYPAFVLSAFKPALVLASSRTPGGGRMAGSLRIGLAMLQFAAVVAAFILMAGFMLQIRHIETADLGFGRENLMMVKSMLDPAVTPAQRQEFIDAVSALPAVRHASVANTIPGPGTGPGSFAKLVRPGQSASATSAPNINATTVGPDYFQMMGVHVLAGRVFALQRAEDHWDGRDNENRVVNIVVSRRAARNMGFASPQTAVDQMAKAGEVQMRIIGVVEDMHFNNPNEPMPPRLYFFDANAGWGIVMVRYHGMSEPLMREALGKVWRQLIPDVPFDAISAATNLDTYYKPERDRSHLFDIGTGIAALIGCMGLYGVAAFNTGRRVREIGMRKVLGASRGQIVRLLLVQFLWPVAVASLLAWPIAWITLQRWLSQFDDVIAMPLWLFPLASAAALLIALVTVAGIAFAAASTEPGKALRHE